MFDPISIGLAFKAMQAAYEGINYCCEALSEGKVAVKKIKQATEDAKVIVQDVKGIWGFFKGLFSKPEVKAVEPTAPAPKKKEIIKTHIPNETEIVQQFVQHLGEFFRNHKKLSEYVEIRYEEVFASQDPNPEDILELSVYKNELDQTYVKLSGIMRGANVPPQLGPLWDNYNQIYSKVQAEQSRRKEQIRIRRQQETNRLDRIKREQTEMIAGLFLTLVIVAWLWAVWLTSFSEAL